MKLKVLKRYYNHCFFLPEKVKRQLQDMEPEFGYDGFGELVYYRTYSREKEDGSQEHWADTVIRVVEGCFSIRKDYYRKNHIAWHEDEMQAYAKRFAIAMFKMEWLPPGRGLWSMGTQFVYERGSMSLFNCGLTHIDTATIGSDIYWLMDALMCGVGAGFRLDRDDELKLYEPHGTYDFIIPDTREGWCQATQLLVEAFMQPDKKLPRMIYDQLRPKGAKIKGFGGIASGPEPLRLYHQDIVKYCHYCMGDMLNYDNIQLRIDLANGAGCTVVAGNVRRSAELAACSIDDPVFLDLKNYDIYPYRESIGWISNNSVLLNDDEDFERLGEIAKRVIRNGEPGYINLRNLPLGRIGKKFKLKKDKATGLNPCQPGWAKLLTPTGISDFNHTQEGYLIWTTSGWRRILKKWSTGNNRVYKYTTTAGVFYGTGNHRIVTEAGKIPIKDTNSINIIRGARFDIEDKSWFLEEVIDGLVIGGVNYHERMMLNIGDYLDKSIKGSLPEEIPDKYIYAPFEIVVSFLRGLYSANGFICGNKIILKNASFKLIEQIQLMLSAVGIRSYWIRNEEQSYDLNIDQDKEIFARNIGFIQKNKQEELNNIKPSNDYKHYYDIISVEFISEEETFDITVDNDSHTYWTQGCNVSNCGEIPLLNKELCNVVETLPTRCPTIKHWHDACEYATFYASTVSLLPTHHAVTNAVIAKNRRIGVSIIDMSGWKHENGVCKITRWMRDGYKLIRKINKRLAKEAGVPESIRVTTIKPGGTTPKLAGRTPGIGHPTFDYTLRRIRIQQNSPIHEILTNANIPYEEDRVSMYTDVFEYPIIQGPAVPAEQVTLWEQAMNLVLVQREWADNSVSNTLYFKPKWKLISQAEVSCEDCGWMPYIVEPCSVMQCMKCGSVISPNDQIINFINRLKTLYGYPSKFDIDSDGSYQNDQYKIIIKRKKDIPYKVNLYQYDPQHEEDHVEPVLSMIAPLTKTVSLLPHTAMGVYPQMVEEGITKEEYLKRKEAILPIDWSSLRGSDGEDERYCTGPSCEIPG